MLRHYINDQLVDEPAEWEGLTEELVRDYDERMIYVRYPNNLTFVGGGYSTLRTIFEDGYCNTATYRLEKQCGDGWDTLFDAVIIIADITWNLSKCTADTPITDTSVGAKILNNKNVEVFAGAARTKNGLGLTPVPPIALEYFNETTGAYSPNLRNTYDWGLCMAHLLSFISDNTITFQSDWYTNLPDDEKFGLVTGVELRTFSGDTRTPSYNFKDLFGFVWKSDNLMAGIVDNVFRLETADYWNGTGELVTYLNQEDLEQSIDTDMLYARVRMGSEDAIKNEDADPQYPLIYVGLRTFAEEEYTLEGQCNTDTALELVLPFVVCTNAISDTLGANDDLDERVFVVQYTESTSRATQGVYLADPGPPYLYNERFLNINVINRWDLPSAGISYYSDVNASFRAEYTVGPTAPATITINPTGAASATTTTNRWQFDNDYTAPNFDIGNNWGNGTGAGTPVSQANSRYTAPIQGYYTINVVNRLRILSVTPPVPVGTNPIPNTRIFILARTIWRHFNSAGTLLNTYTSPSPFPPFTGPVLPTSAYQIRGVVGTFDITHEQGMYLQATDYVEVGFSIVGYTSNNIQGIGFPQNPASPMSIEYSILNGTYCETTFVATFGGEVTPPDPDAYYATVLEFTRHIDDQTWAAAKADYSLLMGIAPDGSTVRKGYLRNVSRRVYDGETEVELIANRNQTNV